MKLLKFCENMGPRTSKLITSNTQQTLEADGNCHQPLVFLTVSFVHNIAWLNCDYLLICINVLEQG